MDLSKKNKTAKKKNISCVKSIGAKAKIKAGIRKIRLNWTFCCACSNVAHPEMNPGREEQQQHHTPEEIEGPLLDTVNSGPYDPTQWTKA